MALSTTSSFTQTIAGKMILAPLTRGGNLPFRRLCCDFGAQITLGEMVFSRQLIQGNPIEHARLRRATNEGCYGVQMATKQVEEGVQVMQMAKKAGADFVDLNVGCPIHEATRRGLGSAMLRDPERLGKLVEGIVRETKAASADGICLPLTVKIRLGYGGVDTINVREVVQRLRDTDGAVAAVTIHGRTARQRYHKSADWDLIKQVVEDGKKKGDTSHVPIVGNGDILTYYEAQRRLQETDVDAVMVGRGALIKPWIFQEFNDGIDWQPDVKERISVYRTLTCYMKDHFGDDDMGKNKAWNFLPWHFDFLSRYQPYPIEKYGEQSRERPLMGTRFSREPDTPLETLLCHTSPDAHELISHVLWESESDADACQKLEKAAEGDDFKRIQERPPDDEEDATTTELANIPSSKKKKWRKRGTRPPPPKRTPEEIAAIRAERAAKKARREAEEAAEAAAAAQHIV